MNLNITAPTSDPSFLRPSLVASSNYVYVASPKNSEIVMINIKEQKIEKTMKLPSIPYRMAVIGHEFNKEE